MDDVSSTTEASARLHDPNYRCDRQSIDRPAKPKIPPSTTPKHPAAVARRNARERNRVRQVNQGFVYLRNHIPQSVSKAKKLSKVETLRQAANYIRYLRDMLAADGAGNCSFGEDGPAGNCGPTAADSQNFFYASSTPPIRPSESYFADNPYSSNCSESAAFTHPKTAAYGQIAAAHFKISPSSANDSPQSSSFGSSGSSEIAHGYECVTPPQLKQYNQQPEFHEHNQPYRLQPYPMPHCESPIQPHSMKMYS